MSSVETCSLSDTSKIMCFFSWWMDVPTFHFFSHFCKNEKFLTRLLPWISDYLFASLDYKAQLKWRSTLGGSFVSSSIDVDLHGKWTDNTYIVKMAEMLPLKVYLFTFGCSVHKSSWILDVCELLCWQPFDFFYLKMFIGTKKGCLLLNRGFCSQREQFLFFMDWSPLRIVTKKRRDAFHECVLLHRAYTLKVQLNLNIQKLTNENRLLK